jgi:hypothetical protein
MKMLPEPLIMNGQKIMCLKMEKVTWLESLNYLAMPLRKLPEAFGLTVQKSWYPQYFNTAEHMNYVGPAPDVSYYVVDEMQSLKGKSFSRGRRPSPRRKCLTTGESKKAIVRPI